MATIRINFQQVEAANQTLKQALLELDEVQDDLEGIRRGLILEDGQFDALWQELETVIREADALSQRGRRISRLVKQAVGSYRIVEAQLRQGF